MDNDPKHSRKANQELFKAKKLNQSPDLSLTEHAFHFFKTKLKKDPQTGSS